MIYHRRKQNISLIIIRSKKEVVKFDETEMESEYIFISRSHIILYYTYTSKIGNVIFSYVKWVLSIYT